MERKKKTKKRSHRADLKLQRQYKQNLGKKGKEKEEVKFSVLVGKLW